MLPDSWMWNIGSILLVIIEWEILISKFAGINWMRNSISKFTGINWMRNLISKFTGILFESELTFHTTSISLYNKIIINISYY